MESLSQLYKNLEKREQDVVVDFVLNPSLLTDDNGQRLAIYQYLRNNTEGAITRDVNHKLHEQADVLYPIISGFYNMSHTWNQPGVAAEINEFATAADIHIGLADANSLIGRIYLQHV